MINNKYKRRDSYGNVKRNFFVQGLIVSVIAKSIGKAYCLAQLSQIIGFVRRNGQAKTILDRNAKEKIENYYSLNAKVNNISCIVDKYLEANKIMGINSFFWNRFQKSVGSCVLD